MKYMVMVNGRYMVSVEANSLCGAEHVILDRYADVINKHGIIKGSQAFEQKDMNKRFFLDLFETCETISVKGLDDKIGDVLAEINKRDELAEQMKNRQEITKSYEDQIAELEKQIEALSHQRYEAKREEMKATVEYGKKAKEIAEMVKNF